MLNPNYFTYQNQVSRPTKKVVMGFPISGTITEVFLQSLERTHFKHILDQKLIIFYTRYIDDILIIYDTTQMNLDTITHITPTP